MKNKNETDKNIGKKAYKKGNGLFSGLIGTVQKYDGNIMIGGYNLILPDGSRVYSKLEDLVFVEDECSQFGNMDGMNGSCHYCKEDNQELFQACWNDKSKDIKPKTR